MWNLIDGSYPHPLEVVPSTSFISVVITVFNRPYFLPRLLDSLEKHADMPYEVIIHDDGSAAETREALFKLSDRISTLVYSNGWNLGMNAAVNRATAVASSKYVFFIPDDCYFTKPCFRDICNVLSKPYIGLTCPLIDGTYASPELSCSVDGTLFGLSSSAAGPGVCAYRKDVWEEVGGWDMRCTSGQSDNVFFHKIYKAGYWRALLVDKPSLIMNEPLEGFNYESSTAINKGNDCSIPKLFGIEDKWYEHLNHTRREACQWWVDGERTILNRHEYIANSFTGQKIRDTRSNPEHGGLNDLDYWHKYFMDLFGGKHSTDVGKIDWELASRYNMDRWKVEILRDFGLEK